MCHQVTYTLPCEHVRTQIIYCAAATTASSKGSSSKSKSGKSSSGSSSTSSGKVFAAKSKSTSSSSFSSSHHEKKPCTNLTVQALPYPTPPSFAHNPAMYSSSPLSPRCPLPECPFEQKQRCWNCCWCGKGGNETGRCSCVMLIDGNQVLCGHICCPQCEAAAPLTYGP